jgi:hypothetical protein
MAITNGYTTLADLKTYLGISGTTDDARLELAVEAASRAIDMECSRRFFPVTETRYFQATSPLRVDLDDDLLTVTEIATDTTGLRDYMAFTANDYELEPVTAPFRQVYIAPKSARAFPVNERRGVRINAAWGYCAAGQQPQAITRACLILATRYFKRKDAPFGVLGTPELGYLRVTEKDPEVRALLQPYRRYEMGAV